MLNETEIIDQMKKAGLDKQKPQRKKEPVYNYTLNQIEEIKKAEYMRAYIEIVDDATQIAQDLCMVNVIMYLIDNFHCKGPGVEKFIDYIQHMNKLREQGQYRIADNIAEIEKETGIKVLAHDSAWERNAVRELDKQHWVD